MGERIAPERIGNRAELSEAIGKLFQRTGRSYLDVATAAGVSDSTVHDMTSGNRFPRWGTLEAVLVACGITEASALSAWREAHRRAQGDGSDPRLRDAQRRKLIPLPWASGDEADAPAPERVALGRPVLRFARTSMSLAARPWKNLRTRHRDRQRELMLKAVGRQMQELIAPSQAHHYLTPRFHAVGSKDKAREIDIRELYEEAGEELVVLSAPGMGKTTQLARLADRLAAEALEDLHRLGGTSIRPIPVLVSLSAYRGQPLADWLPTAVKRQYDFPEELVRGWLTRGLLLPLFDGLDQVPDARRGECAEQLRRFRLRRTGIVVGCRYDDLSMAKRIGAARYVQLSTPTKSDVEGYLLENFDALADVHAALKANPRLGRLLRSPLMLNIIYGAYQGRAAPALHASGKTDKQRQQMIFDAYVHRMLRDEEHTLQQTLQRSDSPEQTVKWVTWLARNLNERHEDVFYLDRLDLEWLRTKAQQVLPRALPTFMATTTGELLALLWLTVAVTTGALDTSLSDAIDVTRAAVVTSASQALITQIVLIRYPTRPFPSVVWNVPVILVMWAGLTKIHWLAPGMIILLFAWLWLQLTTLEGWYFPVLVPVEQIRWCWTPREAGPSLRGRLPARGVFTVAATIVMTGLLVYLSSVLLPGQRWAVFMACFMLMAAYLLGNNFETSLEEKRPTPNEGIRRSLRFALVHGAASATLVGATLLALFLLARSHVNSVKALLIAGFVATLFGVARAYRYGGLAIVRHWAIRAALAASGDTPLRYKQFLHDAEQRILLRRLGSGYAFPHQLLREHLAVDPETLLSRLANHDAAKQPA
ncbi:MULTISPECIES: helix-turn-helix domain-containing protein [unclassified Streptomyces]|uniref:NACHT domain-containing protein n=1 Tax=unclassified Streptomyces TaxID=2593676 RepID=UPI002DD8A3A7|nr:helix-turn-helix domain-containing protein [Streptomyces sp. NBC_01750]WSB05047.1 helix-turn-helix domain-containing protein [Streptomyces sp. NBC_01794]WSD30683.1 helix-turn-helix domain-containing protein [Streptomyces sp. NBC_01750]